MTKGK